MRPRSAGLPRGARAALEAPVRADGWALAGASYDHLVEYEPEALRKAITDHVTLIGELDSPDAVLQRLGLLDAEEAFADLADFSVERLQAAIRHADDVESLIAVCLFHGLAIGLQLGESSRQ